MKEKQISDSAIARIQNEGGKNALDLLGLYILFAATANKQKTYTQKITNQYLADCTCKGIQSIRARRNELLKMGLI